MADYRMNDMRLELSTSFEELSKVIERYCGFKEGTLDPRQVVLRRVSIDARKKTDIHYVVSADFSYEGKLSPKAKKRVVPAPDLRLPTLCPGNERMTNRPVVIGFGPCGIFAALTLAEAGYRPLVIERGEAMDQRIQSVDAFWQNGLLNPSSNVLFGEGGAGTFSDGKLTTGIRDPRIHHVLQTFVDAGAPEDILWQHKPHIGTDILRKVVVNLRKRIEKAGGEICFKSCLREIIVKDGQLQGIKIDRDGKEEIIKTALMILAPGHSARDTFRYLNRVKVPMAQKPFSIGVRMEHPQEMIDRAQYGETDGLPAASYKLSTKASNGRGVYSFCMCPGGQLVTCATEQGTLCVNGMSNRNRDSGTANAGILVDVRTSDFPGNDVLAGVRFQEIWEKRAFELGGGSYCAPACSWQDFVEKTEEGEKVRGCLPDFAVEALTEAVPIFGKKIKGFDAPDTKMTAVETRSSSPVRILRDESLQSTITGLYPAGEGAGYAGGITSAACDGIRVAEAIIRRFAKPDNHTEETEK